MENFAEMGWGIPSMETTGGGILSVELVDILCTCNPNQIIPDRKHTKNIFSCSSHHKYSMLQIFCCFHQWNTLLHSDKILNLFVPSNSNLHSHTALSIDGNHIFRILMLFQILIWQLHIATDRKFEYSYIVWRMLVSTSRRIRKYI